MFKMSFITLACLYLVLLIGGRAPEESGVAVTSAHQEPVQFSSLEISNGPAIKPNAESQVVLASAGGPAVITPAAIATPALAETSDALPPPTIQPVRLAPMPGPALKPSPEYRQPKESVATGNIWAVNTRLLNVRSGPSTSNEIVDRLSNGEQVLVTAERDGWVQIRIEGDGTNGWVSKRLLRPVN